MIQHVNVSNFARKKEKIQTANRLATRRGATSADAVTWDAMSFAWFEQMWFFKHVCSQWLQQPLIHKTCSVSWKKNHLYISCLPIFRSNGEHTSSIRCLTWPHSKLSPPSKLGKIWVIMAEEFTNCCWSMCYLPNDVGKNGRLFLHFFTTFYILSKAVLLHTYSKVQ